MISYLRELLADHVTPEELSNVSRRMVRVPEHRSKVGLQTFYFPLFITNLLSSLTTTTISLRHYLKTFTSTSSSIIPAQIFLRFSSLSSPLSPSLPIFLVSVHTFISPSFLFVLHSLSSCPCPTCAHNPALLIYVALSFLFSHFSSSFFPCVLG